MTMTTIKPEPRLIRSLIAGCALALAALTVSASPLRAQSVAVLVNGDPITNYDIEQRTKLNFLTTHKQMPRQEVIDELIDEKVKIKEGKKYGVDPGVSDVDQSYASHGLADADHAGPADEIAGEPGHPARHLERPVSRPTWSGPAWCVAVSRRASRSAKRMSPPPPRKAASKPKTEAFEYQMQPIILIVPKGAAPAAIELRKKEAEALRERVRTCEAANSYFKSMQNAAIRDVVTRTSADLPVPLRELLDKTPIGHLTAPEITKQGVEMVALCGRKPTTVDTPKKREIREKMYAEKYEKKSKDYLQEIRKAAMIEYR